jgi:hypothetical protein
LEVTPDDHDRGHRNEHEQREADRRCDHSLQEVVGDQLPELVEEADVTVDRVAVDGEHGVGDDEREARVAVPAMPDGQPVEARDPSEEGQPREQEHLHECEVSAE